MLPNEVGFIEQLVPGDRRLNYRRGGGPSLGLSGGECCAIRQNALERLRHRVWIVRLE